MEDSILNKYLDEIGHKQLLSQEEEENLLKKLANKDIEARQFLILFSETPANFKKPGHCSYILGGRGESLEE